MTEINRKDYIEIPIWLLGIRSGASTAPCTLVGTVVYVCDVTGKFELQLLIFSGTDTGENNINDASLFTKNSGISFHTK